ncbi:phage head closure protein [Candidatus Pacearchaeota archaeon]|nr:phage head closure protein [Candidatus Pacearchaeota archaeon]
MRAGSLKQRLTIQVKTETPDGMGGAIVEWLEKDWTEVWAAVIPLRGEELVESMKLEGKVTHRIEMRYRRQLYSLLSPSPVVKRLYWRKRDRYFNIRSVINVREANEKLEIMAEEEV